MSHEDVTVYEVEKFCLDLIRDLDSRTNQNSPTITGPIGSAIGALIAVVSVCNGECPVDQIKKLIRKDN